MRIDASATAITWLPFAALDRIPLIPLELAVAHYDEPPPETVPDIDELRRQDAFREANELRAWIEVDGGEVVDYGQTGRSLIGDGPELESQQVFFPAVEFPVIQPEPEVGDGWVRFTQTVGGRIGLPAHRPVVGRPYFHVGAVFGLDDARAPDPRGRDERDQARRREPVSPPLALRRRPAAR
jgi:hypothetical protein